MALNVSAWAIRKPIPSLVLFVCLVAVGGVSFMSLPVTHMPTIDVPLVSVTINQPGAAPNELETQVTKRVETAVAGLAGVKQITSTIGDGQSTTTVEFQIETPVDRAVDDVRDAVTSIRTDLPAAVDEPLIQRIDVEGSAIVTYAAASPSMSPQDLSWFVDDEIGRTLQGIRGVAQMRREGGVDREIQVSLDSMRLKALGITAADVNDQLARTNIDLAGGRGEVGGQEQSVRTLAGATSLDALAATTIKLPGGRQAQLSDLGSVVDGAAERRSVAHLDGAPVIAFGIYRSKGFSDLVVAEAVAAKLEELRVLHSSVKITLIDNAVRDIEASYKSAMTTLIEGAVLSVVVVFLFLRNVRATIISAMAIPLSILPTFWLMDMLGFSLNTVSLLAITLVTGVLVDDAIVEIENIVRHIRMGKSPYRAAIEAADEIGLAVLATTATIVAVFVPVSFMSGIAGQYFKQFGITVAVAVAFSLLVARLITPMLAAYFMKSDGHVGSQDGVVMRFYARLLAWTLRWRFVTVSAGVAIFAGSVFLATMLPSSLFPKEDTSRSTLNVELPPGATVAQAAAAADRLTEAVKLHPAVISVYAAMGAVASGAASEVRKGSLAITLVPPGDREADQKTIEGELRERIAEIPDMRVNFMSDEGGREFAIVLLGSDGEVVARTAIALETAIRAEVPELRNVVLAGAVDRPEIRIVPKLEAAADLGVSVEEIAQTVRIATVGDVPQNLAKFSAGDRQLDIRVQLEERARSDIATFETLRVRRDDGSTVPLVSVAEIRLGLGPTGIDRYERERRVLIEGDIADDSALSEAIAAVRALPEANELPAGVALQESGDAELMGEVFSSFALAMAAGILLVLAVLVLLFADILQPITILLSLPLSIGGALLALLATGHSISMPVVIGFLMLMGIVTKNAILLVDFAIEEIARGVDRVTALVDAGRKRAQPIVMTTVAMSAGMMPSALALGEGSGFRAPMAIAVIGGLIASTLLSLVFVPALFTIMDDLGHSFGWVFGRFVGQSDEATGHLQREAQTADNLKLGVQQ